LQSGQKPVNDKILKPIMAALVLPSPNGVNTGYIGHAYARNDGLVGILISDKDYPLRVSYSLLTKILDEFSLRYPPSKFQSATTLDFPELHNVISLVEF
jgi:Regulated-SNARE-like domain